MGKKQRSVHKLGKKIIRVLVFLGIRGAIVYLLLCVFLYLLAPKLIFQPTRQITKTPASCQLTYRNVWLSATTKTGKSQKIHGWWIPNTIDLNNPDQNSHKMKWLGSMAGESIVKNHHLGQAQLMTTQAQAGLITDYVILYLHGRGLNISANVNQSCHFQRMGFSVLLIDYRGYGQSHRIFPSETTIYQDAELAWQYLVKKAKIPRQKILIYGHSLGGAVAIDLALKHPEAAGAIVQSSFTSMTDMAKLNPIYRLFPISLILQQKFPNIDKVKSLQIPTLFIHGQKDTFIPPIMTQKLYNATPKPKQILFVPEGGHNNGDSFFKNEKYRQTLINFVNSIIYRKIPKSQPFQI